MSLWRFLTAPVFALFDLKLYREAAQLTVGKAVLYCAYLSLIFCIAVSILMASFMPKADDFMRWLKNEWPAFTLTDAGLRLDSGFGQKSLVHPDFGSIAAFDDTKTTISEEEMGDFYFYLTSTALYTRSQSGLQSRALTGLQSNTPNSKRQVQEVRFDGENIEKIYFKFKPLVVSVLLVVVFIFGIISRLIAGLVLSAVGYLIQLFISRKLSFEKLFVLAAFSLSIGLVFSILQMIPSMARFFPGFLGFIIVLVYFSIAIAVQDKSEAA